MARGGCWRGSATHDDLGLARATDSAIWQAAREAGAVVMSKDIDFVNRVQRLGTPPQVVWVSSGNISNRALRALVDAGWARAVELLRDGESLIELAYR